MRFPAQYPSIAGNTKTDPLPAPRFKAHIQKNDRKNREADESGTD